MARSVVLAFLFLGLLASALGQNTTTTTSAPGTTTAPTAVASTSAPTGTSGASTTTGAPTTTAGVSTTSAPTTGSTGTPSTSAPTSGATTSAPTTGATTGPTSAGTTGAPTTRGPTTAGTTSAPTTGSTTGPTTAGTTMAPTTGSTTAPTTRGPTTAGTTMAPTTGSTTAPTTRAPTQAVPTPAPAVPTPAPSAAPTPGSGSGSGSGSGNGSGLPTGPGTWNLSYNSNTTRESDLPCPKGPGHCPRTWNYTDAARWGAYCPEYSTCSAGRSQSPVDAFPPVNHRGCVDVPFDHFCGRDQNTTCIFNTGNYFVTPVDPNTNSRFLYNGRSYPLMKVEFHTPSQHLVHGERYDLEVMYYLDSPTSLGRKLVLSFFFDRPANTTDPRPATSPFLEQFVYELPEFSDCSCGNGKTEFLGDVSRFWGVNESCDNNGFNSDAAGSGACCRPNCVRAYCGDGILDANELCDNGTRNSNTTGGACRLNCCLPACGDGVVDPNEDCDDGNNNNFDGCSSICRTECGNGLFDDVREQCDNGTLNSDTTPNACRTYCRLPFCGDGVVDAGEQCDNGTTFGDNPSQCRFNCTLPYCGDGITDLNEQCDDGTGVNGPTHTCSSDCRNQCGDGVVQSGEECDDGALNSNAPNAVCRTNCYFARCGDGIIDDLDGEQCDSVHITDASARPYNTIVNIYCSSNCTQLCGNGVFDAGEQCDHGCYNADLPNRCRPNCERPRCGDGIVDLNEECDFGAANANGPNTCRLNCTVPKCGDGWLDLGEQCDDGNRREGDGCDPTCRNECGNGLIENNEECDYGMDNANTPDRCRINCRLPVCGDGITDYLEDCDDGAANSNTAPNACRLNCRRPYCGDNVIDWALGEKCDFGRNNSDTTVDGCSLFCIPNYCRQRCYNTSIDWAAIQPSNTTAYSYQGSLSYPPCTEGYEYLLFASVQPLSNFQYQSFAGAPHGLFGARPVQSLNGRTFARPCVPPPPSCGNGWVESGEECDLGLNINSDWQANRCRTNCTLPHCGDGVTDRGEECDDGQWNENIPFHQQRCDSSCRLFPRWTNPYVAKPWNYNNTCKWSYQSPAWSLCAADRVGATQSPININTTWESLLRYGPPVSLWPGRWNTSTYKVVYTKRGLSLTIDQNSTNVLNDNGKSYFLKQIDFHVRSEHTINGYHADVEADFWHQTNTGESAVLAVLFNVSKTQKSKFFSQFEFYYPHDHICRYDNGVVEAYLNEECDDGPSGNSDSKPDHCRLKGKLPTIGDGIVDRGEQCDDGYRNAYKADHCRPNGWLPYCGDGIQDSNEECDFADIGLARCTTQCTLLCGNGLIDAGEQCDNGTMNNNEFAGPWQCRNNCSLPYCGDGVCDPNEDCDDGDFNSNTVGGACRTNCRLPRCGDAVTDFSTGEECDDGAANSATGRCLPNCRLSCGSGLPIAGTNKQCDNGTANANTDGACRTDCTLPRCGDSIIDRSRGEECDPPGPGCAANCSLTCGNGILDAGEVCDFGTANDDTIPNHCRTTCTNFTCGDGVRDWNEACDFGTLNSNAPNAPCRSGCTLPFCGDGIVDSQWEECDDGNNVSGDNCTATCQWECGNGHRDSAAEECDWGVNNGLWADSCRPRGFIFNGVHLGCTMPFCGDGILDSGEQCDNGRNNSYAPNACRPDCTLPYCGDGVRDTYYGEWCDLGNGNNDFAGNCSTTCVPNECRTVVPPSGRYLNFTSFFGNVSSPIVKYYGSLTRPPCSENVAYYVLTKVQPLSEAQFWELKWRINGNHREIQALNGRQPVYYATSGPTCGNCIKEDGEECDLGSENGGWGCRTTCTKPRCGDGILDDDEECDHGASNNSTTSPCTQWCKWVTKCPSSPCPGQKNCCNTCNQGSPKPCCSQEAAEVVNNTGTIINVNFAGLLKGAGCTGPNCRG